jgi:hypothetical protein
VTLDKHRLTLQGRLKKIMKATVKCYSPETHLLEYNFFVLNKGLNAGKPMRTPCANCFVVQTDSQQTLDRYYYLSWALWQARGFHSVLSGSVVEFIHIDDYRAVMDAAECSTDPVRDRFTESVSQFADIQEKHSYLRSKLDSIVESKRNILARVLNL